MSMWFATAVASVMMVGCPDDGGEASDDDGGSTSGGSEDTMTMSSTATSPSTTSGDCIAGQLDCICQDGACQGLLHCVDNMCVEGPEFDPQGDPVQVVAGLRVPFDVEVMADSFSWSQVDGPEVTFSATDQIQFDVDVPPDAGDGTVITLRLSATRNTIEDSSDYRIEILPAAFFDLYDGAEEGVELPAEVGTSVAVTFGQGSVWIVSAEGNVTRINQDGLQLQEDIVVGGAPAGISLGEIGDGDNETEVAFVANAGTQAVQSLNVFGGDVSVFADMVGEVSHVMYDGNTDDVFFTNGVGGQFWQYFDNDGQVYMLSDTLGTEPSAMTIGPEANIVYVATLGEVWRVPILLTDEDPQTPVAGDPELYLDVGGPGDPLNAISGMRFDDGVNLWVSVPGQNALHVARYSGGGATSTIRTIDNAPAGLNGFNGLAFAGDSIFWANGADRVIGGLRVGLGGF